MSESEHRRQVIDKILTFQANTYTQAFLDGPHPKTGKKYSNAELDAYLAQLQVESVINAEDQIIRAQAEIYAERALHQLHVQQAAEPQRKAEAAKKEARSREIFSVICRKHNLSECEANFRVLFDSGLLESVYAADQAITSNAVSLAKADPETSSQFEQERVESHNDTLRRMDPVQLKARVRQEAADSRATAVQQQADRQFEASRARDAVMGFPPLPETWNGNKLDAAFIKTCSVETQKLLQRRFGSAQITALLQGKN